MMLPPMTTKDLDASIRQTDNDAALARLSAVRLQYLADPYISSFVPRAHLQPSRPPLINIGTHARTWAMDNLVEQWLSISPKVQIVSLGAGSDTRFWRISTSQYKDHLAAYVELDFPEITTKKTMSIRKSKDLSAALGAADSVKLGQGGTALHSPIYHLLPADLRRPPSSFVSPLTMQSASHTPVLDPSLPTLLLFECVLAYMTPAASSSLIGYFASTFGGPLGVVVYEMFGLEDSFGKVMKSNLQARSVTLPGVEPFNTEASLPRRFDAHNFTRSSAMTLYHIRQKCIPKAELDRVASLEMLDEVEELDLVLQHYAVTWGMKLSKSDKAAWLDWGLRTRETASEIEEEE